MAFAIEMNTHNHGDQKYWKPEWWIKASYPADQRQGYRDSQKTPPMNADRAYQTSLFWNPANRRRGLRNRLMRNLYLRLAGRNPDLWGAAGRAERRLILDLAAATIAVVFHKFTLQEPARSWQRVSFDPLLCSSVLSLWLLAASR